VPGDFEIALSHRIDAMLDACTRCGKCFEACPITSPAGLANADPHELIAGVLDIVRLGDGPEVSRTWANSCVASGECMKVCDYGVNPRFLLSMARVSAARRKNEPHQQRKLGVDGFRLVARDVMQLSRMQLPRPSSRVSGRTRAQKAASPANCRTWCSTPAATC